MPQAHTEHRPSSIRVLLVDDNPGFMQSARRFLAAEPGIEIVGWATSGQAALELVARLQPDLVLMDVRLPGLNGLEAARRIKVQPGAPCVIIVTLYDTPEYREAAQRIHADGFVAKADFGTQVLPSIRTLYPSRR